MIYGTKEYWKAHSTLVLAEYFELKRQLEEAKNRRTTFTNREVKKEKAMPMTYPAPATAINMVSVLNYDAPDPREQYRSVNGGEEPPAFDRTKPPKYWAIPKAMQAGMDLSKLGYYAGNLRRLYRDYLGLEPTLSDISNFLEFVNLPGPFRWPKWEPAASGATFADGVFPKEELSLSEEAVSLAVGLQEVLGVPVYPIEDQYHESKWQIHYANTEKRRKFVVYWYGTDGMRRWLTVGTLLMIRHANGMGRPGKWMIPPGADASNPIAWVSDPEDTTNTMEPVPVPQRELLATEEWRRYLNPAGNSEWYVYLKEALPVDIPPPTTDTTAIMIELDWIRAKVDAHTAMLKAIKDWFRIP